MSARTRIFRLRWIWLAAACLVGEGIGAAPAGTWPMWRHDAGLTGYQPLPGAMAKEPVVLARHFVGATTGVPFPADLRGTGAADDVVIAARARLTAWDRTGRRLWECAPAGYAVERVEWVCDLDGDGRPEVVALAGHLGGTRLSYLVIEGSSGALRAAIDFSTGDFSWRGFCGAYLPGVKGRQIFIVTSKMQAADESALSNGSFALWRFTGESAVQVWTGRPAENVLFYPGVMLADLRGDGSWCAVVSSWCHVWVVNLADGAVVSHTAWKPEGANVRHYGWNELVDVDGDGRPDYVNLSLTKHIDVLCNEGGALRLAWTRGWTDPVTTEALTFRFPADPVVDLDGDGRREIVAAIHDSQGGRRWVLTVFDGGSGREMAVLPDLVPLATVPRKEGAWLFCARTKTLEYDAPEALEAWTLRKGAMVRAWSMTGSRLLTRPLESDDRHALQFNAMRMQRAVTEDTDGDGRDEFFTVSAEGVAQAWGAGETGVISAKAGSPPAKALAAAPASLPALNGTMVPHLLVADTDGSKPNELILYDNKEATVLRLAADKLERVETVATTEIPVVCDLMGDGRPWMLTAGRGADGNLWVEPRAPGRKSPWHFVFPHSGACGAFSERPHFFLPGRFTGGKHLDLLTYATKPAARTYLLDGRTGQVVWERSELPGIERHFQPLFARASAADFEGDGADDVVFTNPDFYCVADGRTGELKIGPVEIRKQTLNWWAAYASPAVLANPGGRPFVYLGGVYSARGAIAADGTHGLWLEFLPTERWPIRPGNAGFNEGLLPPHADRGWRGGQVEADGTLVCFEAETGRVAWRMAMAAATSGLSTGDVDGDGAADFVLGLSNGELMAITDEGGCGRVLWRKCFDAPVGTPILADLNADGKSEIAVSVGDGFVYVVGIAPPATAGRAPQITSK